MKWYIDFLHYCPVWVEFVFFFFISTVWFLIGKKIRSQTVWKKVNVGLLIVGALLIVWYTLLSRIGVEIDGERVVWIPFQKDTLIIPIIWTWRAAIDNVLLFIPLGMSVSQLSRKKLFLLLGLIVSLAIEITQCVLCMCCVLRKSGDYDIMISLIKKFIGIFNIGYSENSFITFLAEK